MRYDLSELWGVKDPGKIIAFACNKEGDTWAASENEIYQLEEKIFRPVGIKKILSGKILISDISIINGQLWFINAAETIILYTATGGNFAASYFFKEFTGQKILSDSRIIHQSDFNTIWIGGRSEGLIKIDLAAKTFENAGALGTTLSTEQKCLRLKH